MIINVLLFGTGFVLGMYILTQIENKLWSLFVRSVITRQTYTK